MNVAMAAWALLALAGIALAIFAADPVSNALGIVLGLVGVIGFLQAIRRRK
jgi:hypothetical protein